MFEIEMRKSQWRTKFAGGWNNGNVWLLVLFDRAQEIRRSSRREREWKCRANPLRSTTSPITIHPPPFSLVPFNGTVASPCCWHRLPNGVSVPARRGRYIYRRKSHLAKSSKVSRESIVVVPDGCTTGEPDKSGSMPDDDAWHKHSRDKRDEE